MHRSPAPPLTGAGTAAEAVAADNIFSPGRLAPPHGPRAAGPPGPDPLVAIARLHRVRRLFAAGLAAVGLFDLVTSVLPPARGQLTVLLHFAPIEVAQAAAALLALCGLVLLALVPALQRGQRQAWAIASIVLATAAALHLARGIDAVQCALSLTLVVALFIRRATFAASTDRHHRRSGTLLLVGGALSTVVFTTASVETFLALHRHGADLLPLHVAVLGVVERMAGAQTVAFPRSLNTFLAPTLLGVGICLAVLTVLIVSRPLVDRRSRSSEPSCREARRLVGCHGGGTLDYFALRDDKHHHFYGETLTTYAVHAGVCLVSPDPIGPPAERDRAWAEFCRYADGRGWIVAVLGADASWLPTYRRSGLRSQYVGDEAIVRLADFDLSGGHKKGLRQAVNRIAKYGYTVSFHDPLQLEPELAERLRGLMGDSRRGEQERGFSMTLGRLFDPDDTGLLLAVAHGVDGAPVAFCQFVPAPAIDGYSLDLMRRDRGGHPNGLIDFLIVRTIEHLHRQGMSALGLNFATMRAVLAGESGDTVRARVLSAVLRRLSRSMQIESLWRFTAKYDPEWVARYLVFGTYDQLVPVGLAVAKAESFWEIPLVGRYLRPDGRRAGWGRAPEPGRAAA